MPAANIVLSSVLTRVEANNHQALPIVQSVSLIGGWMRDIGPQRLITASLPIAGSAIAFLAMICLAFG
ncbi:MAG: hypothetical protein JO110_01100 [Acetobacteraceae bacterium]|nr:hypothetical protein [Acetobacteraceae bacterium]